MAESSKRRGLKPVIIILAIAVVLLAPPFLIARAIYAPGPLTANVTVIIPHGAGVHEIAALLDREHTIMSPLAFRVASRVLAVNSLKAGEYEITPGESTVDIINKMHDGRSVVHMFTAAEGLTSAEIVGLMKDNPALAGNIAVPPEGSLLPETYRYSYGDTRAALVARMQKAMQEALGDLWTKRDTAIPLKLPEEAVVMASIIEKETGKAAERPRIAAVFYNRLRQNMRLQSDPTVIYAITRVKGEMHHDLTHNDLSFASPYNTYASDGLPPQPICNPGRAALEAALHPEQNDFLYFVADGTGGHVFAHNLGEHNQNVAKSNSLSVKPPSPPPHKPH